MSKENYFSRTMAAKDDAELGSILANPAGYPPDALDAARWEVERRAEAQAQALEEQVQEPEPAEEPRPALPSLYSDRFIMIFGILFSVIGASILIAINFRVLKMKSEALLVIAVALIYSMLQGMILGSMQATLMLSVPLSIVGILILQKLVWNRYVPYSGSFPRRSIWIPLAVGVAVSVLLILLVAPQLMAAMKPL